MTDANNQEPKGLLRYTINNVKIPSAWISFLFETKKEDPTAGMTDQEKLLHEIIYGYDDGECMDENAIELKDTSCLHRYDDPETGFSSLTLSTEDLDIPNSKVVYLSQVQNARKSCVNSLMSYFLNEQCKEDVFYENDPEMNIKPSVMRMHGQARVNPNKYNGMITTVRLIPPAGEQFNPDYFKQKLDPELENDEDTKFIYDFLNQVADDDGYIAPTQFCAIRMPSHDYKNELTFTAFSEQVKITDPDGIEAKRNGSVWKMFMVTKAEIIPMPLILGTEEMVVENLEILEYLFLDRYYDTDANLREVNENFDDLDYNNLLPEPDEEQDDPPLEDLEILREKPVEEKSGYKIKNGNSIFPPIENYIKTHGVPVPSLN
jgi:hypothetical protein